MLTVIEMTFFFPFFAACSTNGRMTAMVDLSQDVQNGVNPATTHLLDRNCRPKDSDQTAVLFSFALNSCGTTVKVAASTGGKSSPAP